MKCLQIFSREKVYFGYAKYEMHTIFYEKQILFEIYVMLNVVRICIVNDFWRLMVLKSGATNTDARLKSIGRINCIRIWNKFVSAPRKRE